MTLLHLFLTVYVYVSDCSGILFGFDFFRNQKDTAKSTTRFLCGERPDKKCHFVSDIKLVLILNTKTKIN